LIFKRAGVDLSRSVGLAVKGCGADSSGLAHRSTLVIPVQPRISTVRCFCLYQLIKRVLPFPMHSALAYTCSAATASDTPVPSRAVFFRQTTRARRLRPRQFAASLFSYSLAPIREGYELLFPPARPNHFVFPLLTDPLPANPFVFIIIRIAPGCGDQIRELLPFFSVRSVSLWQIHSFHTLAASLPAPKKSTPLQSSKSSLFFGNTRGGGTSMFRRRATQRGRGAHIQLLLPQGSLG
jgi:hypothetical protein